MKRRHLGTWVLTLGLLETACIQPGKNVGELSSDSSDATTTGSPGDPSSSAGSEESEGSAGLPTAACGPEGPPCLEDDDRDCVGQDEDNAPTVHNPDQSDHDGDGIADPLDACPWLAAPGGHADADGDGVGDDCDPCRRAAAAYEAGTTVDVLGYMRIRNVPSLADADGDGIGDACDNCIHEPNCDAYGPAAPWQPGDPIPDGDAALCQGDVDRDLVGDACQGLPPLPGAAGVVGLGPEDDFDQDGLDNVIDACPRAPLGDAVACTSSDDCPATRKCETSVGLCDHADADADGVGDVCDSCPSAANPLQVADGAQEEDDDDGDFRGNICESSEPCTTTADPTRTGFYPVSVGGWCCTASYPGDSVMLDPDGLPILVDCDPADEGLTCRRLPPVLAVMPGVVVPPAGCDDALAAAGLTVQTHLPLTPDDVGGLAGLAPYACQLQPLDQDFDGLGDACDTCPLAFDPQGEPFIDEDGVLWPDAGKYCNGDYSTQSVCMGG